MLSRAFITKIEGSAIYAMQLVTDNCATCTAECLYRGKPFCVTNKRKFSIEKGSVVRIGMSRYKRAVHAFSSLILPVVCAVMGYVFSAEIAKKIGLENTELFKAACIVVFLAVSAGGIFAISRSSMHLSKPEILQVLS